MAGRVLFPRQDHWRNASRLMSEYLDLLGEFEDFSGTVLVGYGDEVVFEQACGLADVQNQTPAAADTIFRIGSVTKPVTAAVVLQLHDDGVLSIAEHISEHVRDLPSSWAAITIHQLLTHTSGIPSYTHLPDYRAFANLPSTPETILERVKGLHLQFRPGERFAYSNSGYVLLGLLLERLSGKSYTALLQETIFDVLGLADTGIDLPAAMLPRLAKGYESEGGELVMAPYTDMSVAHAAGALYSTVEDLRRFAVGLFNGRLLSDETLRTMLTPGGGHYACGWFISENNQYRMAWHNGGIGGFSSHLAVIPDARLTVVVLSNHADGVADASARALSSIGLGETYRLPQRRLIADASAGLLRRYEGVYEMDHGLRFLVTVENGRLYLQATGQERFLARAMSEMDFFVGAVDAEMRFVDDDNGRPRLVLRQHGKDFFARKTS